MKYLLTLCLSLAVASAVAQEIAAPKSNSLQIATTAFRATLSERFPSTTGAKIEPAFPDFWAVIKDGDVVFIRNDLSVLVRGDVVDLKSNQSLTNFYKEANKPKFDVTQIDTKDAIVFGRGTRTLYIFSDPDCPFCKRLEPELALLKDVKIYILPYPLISLHPNAKTVAQHIWCAKNPATAWRDYLIGNKTPNRINCTDTPIERNLALGQKFNVNATPTLILSNGDIVPGYFPADRLEALIQGAK